MFIILKKKLQLNKKYYKIYIILKNSILIWTIYLIYLQEKGLNFTQIMTLNSISALVTFLCEIPSGILADKYSRKNSLIAGELLLIINLIIVLFSSKFYILALNSILSGIGNAFISGAGNALIYDSFKLNNEEHNYKSYISDTFSWTFKISAISTLLTGVLYKFNIHYPIIVSILFNIIAFIFAVKLYEFKKNTVSNENLNSNESVFDNFVKVIKNFKVLKILLLYILMTIIISNINFLSQAYLKDININISYFGVIYFVFKITSSYGAKYAKKIKLNNKKIYIVTTLYSLVLIGLYVLNNYFGILFFIISRFINGMVWPILDVDLNSKIESDNRATILSYKSLFIQISFIIFDPIIGFIIDKTNVQFIYLVMGIILLSITVKIILKQTNQNKAFNTKI